MKRIPQNEIYRILSGLAGTVGLYVEDCQSGEIFTINPEHVFPSASVIKVPMLALLMRDAQQGLVDLDAPAPSTPATGWRTGILCELGTDYTPSLRDLAKLMIVLSDNIATNEIMDVIGMERFNSFCREMGYQNITLMRKMMDFEAIQQGKNNYMCAGETGRLLSAISRGEIRQSGDLPDHLRYHGISTVPQQAARPSAGSCLLLRLQVRHPGRAGPGGQQDRRPGGHPARRGHL